jgi:hypothetical protein
LSNIPTTIINWGLVVWTIRNFLSDREFNDYFWAYAILAGASTIFYFVISIVAAYKARQGKMYYFLLFGKISYEVAFKVRPADSSSTNETINKPPF